ncbi:MAG: hypothetical protein SVG88_05475 [Halobacteriales archaeon]|nr:hypothetical protein [Halobacteriales archaeon]
MNRGCFLLAFGAFLLGGLLAALGLGSSYAEYLLIGGLGGALVCVFLQTTEF